MVGKTQMDYAREKTNWHFDPSVESNDFKYIGNFYSNWESDLNLFIQELENSNELIEISLDKRAKTYNNTELYDKDELACWGYSDGLVFLKSHALSLSRLTALFIVQPGIYALYQKGDLVFPITLHEGLPKHSSKY
jgi:hypothetical protein